MGNETLSHLFGVNFCLHTDHKLLVSILQNPKSNPSARIEKLLLRIQAYTFTTHHQKGSSNPADYISRHPTQHTEYEQAKAQTVEEHVKFVATHSIPKAMSLEDVERATKQDAELQKVLKALTTDDNTLWNDF
ncbi:hypothetical protein QE152_g31283 [Popillia japonica]|uniref:Reverse transcriptase RNase H-like domain-containing protein n=1 Tax=Popillia japonica TaxID=7064 RepID=A0AAW1JBU4_POPJA